MLVDEQHILLEAGVQMRFQAKLTDDRVVVAVDVCVDTVHALEYLSNQRRESLWERHACSGLVHELHAVRISKNPTNSTGKNSFIVDIALHPSHQLLDVGRCSHLGWTLVVLIILPQILEPALHISNSKIDHRFSSNLLVCCLHLRARLGGAELSDGAVQKVDLVVKIHHYLPH